MTSSVATDSKLGLLTQFLAPGSKLVMPFLRAAKDAGHFLDIPLVCSRSKIVCQHETHVSFPQAEAHWNTSSAAIGGITIHERHKNTEEAQKITWRKAEFGDVDSTGHFDLRYVFADYKVTEPSVLIVVDAHLLVTKESFDKLYATLEPSVSQPVETETTPPQ